MLDYLPPLQRLIIITETWELQENGSFIASSEHGFNEKGDTPRNHYVVPASYLAKGHPSFPAALQAMLTTMGRTPPWRDVMNTLSVLSRGYISFIDVDGKRVNCCSVHRMDVDDVRRQVELLVMQGEIHFVDDAKLIPFMTSHTLCYVDVFIDELKVTLPEWEKTYTLVKDLDVDEVTKIQHLFFPNKTPAQSIPNDLAFSTGSFL